MKQDCLLNQQISQHSLEDFNVTQKVIFQISGTQHKINQHTKKCEQFNNIQGKRKLTHAKHAD